MPAVRRVEDRVPTDYYRVPVLGNSLVPLLSDRGACGTVAAWPVCGELGMGKIVTV